MPQVGEDERKPTTWGIESHMQHLDREAGATQERTSLGARMSLSARRRAKVELNFCLVLPASDLVGTAIPFAKGTAIRD